MWSALPTRWWRLDVQVQRAGEWVSAGGFQETGPLASDTRLVRLPGLPAGPLRVRLVLTRGLWRLDQVALVSVGERVVPVRVRPTRVLRHGRPDPEALAQLTGRGGPLVTQPGDTLQLVYPLPVAGGRAELFLQSRGYYLEWMRDSWIAEENAERNAEPPRRNRAEQVLVAHDAPCKMMKAGL